MNIEEFRTFCLSLKGVNEDFPFGSETIVFKVADKIFALAPLYNTELKVNLKYNSDSIHEIREEHDDIKPGFHMNKDHWNTVNFEGKLSEKFLKELTTLSYHLVIRGLSKKKREEYSL